MLSFDIIDKSCWIETQKAADELIVYHSTFLGDRLGNSFQSPSLGRSRMPVDSCAGADMVSDLLADLWFDTSGR